MTSLRKHNDKSPITGKSILYLNRHQTEEWKGWMQASFSWLFPLWLFPFFGRLLYWALIAAVYIYRVLMFYFLTGSVLNVSLLCCGRDIQRYPYLYCCLCLDDWFWKLLLLLCQKGFLCCTFCAGDTIHSIESSRHCTLYSASKILISYRWCGG